MMHLHTLVSESLTPGQRLDALRDWSNSTLPSTTLNILLYIAMSASLIAAVVLLAMHVIARRKSRAGESFESQANRVGLNQAEKNLLSCIARLAGLHNTEAVFTMEQAFVQGAGLLMKGQKVSSMPAEKQARVAGMINALCQKLGFQALGAKAGSAVSSRQVVEGAVLSFTSIDGNEHVATVKEIRDDTIVLDLRASAEFDEGAPVIVHYSNMGCVWEFDSNVVGRQDEMVLIAHSENIRFINRRRFPRVPVRYQALLADLDFFLGEDGIAPPRFTPATLTEIAGPGLLFESVLQTEVGRKVIAITELAGGMTVQAVGRVRRVRMLGNSRVSVVVELIDLKPHELSELARQTSAAGTTKSWRIDPRKAPTMEGGLR